MTRTALARALGATLVLAPALGWTTYKVATAERRFDGKIQIWLDRQLPHGKWQLIDEFNGSGLGFQASLVDMAQGKQVDTKFVLSGKSAKGRPFTVRMVRPGMVQRDLQTGSVMLRLPLRWEINGQAVENEVALSTDATIEGPGGVMRGRRLSVQNGSSPIALVGQTSAGPIGTELVEAERKPGAAEQNASVPFKDFGATTVHMLVDGTVRAVDK